jgi:hypothetical protein
MKYFALRPFLVASLLILAVVPARAQARAPESYASFERGLERAVAGDFVGRPETRVRDAVAFDAMRAHLLSLYRGMPVTSTFAFDGQVYDCVPVAQQPSVRLLGLRGIDTPPRMAPPGSQLPAARVASVASAQNACADGTIPFRRITLDELTRYPTLQDFFDKEPRAVAAHKYAFQYQYVSSRGSYGALDLWDPTIYTAQSEVFSLSQHWTVGLQPLNNPTVTQTAEVGWQKFPAKYGTTNHSVFFIYYTTDSYLPNTGCYNLDCAGFVQTSKSVILGGSFKAYSKLGPPRVDYAVSTGYYAKTLGGNWWLAVNGVWIGYYPVKLYGKGQLAHYSNFSEFGGETVGTTKWPAMGSGKFGISQTSQAAYQAQVQYYTLAGAAHNAALTADNPAPTCYSTTNAALYAKPDYISFFFGGPGGTGC